MTFVLICLLILGGPWLYREWRLSRHRRLHTMLFNPARDEPKLLRWFEHLRAAFPEAASLPELNEVSFDSSDRVAAARAAIDLATERFRYPRDKIELVIGTSPQHPQAAGLAEMPQLWSSRLEGDHIHFAVKAELAEARHRIFLSEEALAEDDDRLAWIAAHEVAHQALALAHLSRAGPEDEEITDLATVVAGYGPLLWRHRYVEERRFGPGGRFAWRVTQFGTLSKPAIAFARKLRQQAIGLGKNSVPPAA